MTEAAQTLEERSTAADILFVGWEDAYARGASAAGGKGWSLGRLHRYGFPVPPGGVLLTAAYREFVTANGLAEAVAAAVAECGDSSAAGCPDAAARLRELILISPLPERIIYAITRGLVRLGLSLVPLAVRSSATLEDSSSASFAGIHESFLNVRGMTDVGEAVKRCWGSLWTERAASYRRRMGIAHTDIEPAIVIMATVEAQAAGVAFSCDPRNGREDVVYITANLGLGESVVAGTAEPDEYAVEVGFHAPEMKLSTCKLGRKEKRTVPLGYGGTEEVASPGASSQQALPEGAILHLARLVRRVYAALGHHELHQDVEWVYDGSRFHLVQARPVTVLPRYTYDGLRNQRDYWSNANLREVLPAVSPLGWTTMSDPLEHILTLPLRLSGYEPLPGILRKRLYAGRGYFNVSVMQWEFHDAFAVPTSVLNSLIGGHQAQIAVSRHTPLGFLRCGLRNLRYLRRNARARKRADAACAELATYTDQIMRTDLSGLSDRELIALIRRVGKRMEEADDIHLVLSGGAATFLVLPPLLERFSPGRGTALANALLAGREDITSAMHGIVLAEMADLVTEEEAAREFFMKDPLPTPEWEEKLPASSPFGRAFREFLAAYGHRGLYELDIRNPRWREDPSWLLEVVKGNIGGGHANLIRERQKETADEAWQEVRERVPGPLRPLVRLLVARVGKEAAQREMAKSTLVRISGVLRKTAQEVARRLVAQGLLPNVESIYYLAWEELEDVLTGEWSGEGLAELAADRQSRHEELERMPAPDIIEEGVPTQVHSPHDTGGDVLTGLGVAAGEGRGVVRIIHHPGEGHRLRPGEVLVAPSTDPAWTPLFLRAAALVTETGCFVSHGAIVAREYGIPAVVNVAGVLKRLKDGDEVTVNGDAGKVIIHQERKI